jgi:hypothetical protein
VVTGALAAASAGCGPPPPQAPVGQAEKVASALSGIAAACGESYQQHAFAPRRPLSASLVASATMRARELADVARRNRAWIYQGETLGELVVASSSHLKECGLSAAASPLASRG